MKKIAVLGSGPMGLAVAYQLALEGYKPIVYESDDRIGGMSASFDFNGLKIERYYHFHCISDRAFLDVLKELSLEDKLQWTATKMGFWFQGKLQSWGNPWALLKFKGLGFIPKIRYGFHAFLCTRIKDWKKLDNQFAIDWLKNWVGHKAFDVLWSKLFDLKFYNFGNRISAAWIWSRVSRIGRSRSSIFKEKLGYLKGGSDTLLHALEKEILTKGGEIRLNSTVKKVILKKNKVFGLEVGKNVEKFDIIISTIPLPYIPKLIPQLPNNLKNKIKKLENIAVICIIVKLRKKLSENFWVNINDESMDIPGIIEYTNLYPMNNSIVYVPFYMPANNPKYKDTDSTFIKKVRKYLYEINPELQNDDFIDFHVHRYRYSQPISEPCFLKKLPPMNIPVDGLWIGDTSFYYPHDRGISESIEFGRKMALEAVK